MAQSAVFRSLSSTGGGMGTCMAESVVRRLLLAGASMLVACGGAQRPAPSPQHVMFSSRPEPTSQTGEVPDWITGSVLENGKLCGFGVAGAGYDEHSPYPKRMAEERAVKNLAGVLGTRVQEVIIDKQTNHANAIRHAKAITVDDALIEKVRGIGTTEYWLDRAGQGPFAAKNFTYARTCVDANTAAASLKVDAKALTKGGGNAIARPHVVPGWTKNVGVQKDGRLCAVGFSLPTFHPDKTFDNVVEDVRWQLAEVIQTFVSSYYEELTTTRSQSLEAMTLATTQAVSKGAVITDYWYDRDGIGPNTKKRSTYGFGCVYPVEVLQSSAAAVEKTAPQEEKNVIAKVRERAAEAFDALDAEIEKQHGAATRPASRAPDEPQPTPTPAPRAPAPPPAPIAPAPEPASFGDTQPEDLVEEPGYEALPAGGPR